MNSGADDFNDEERAVVGGMTLKDPGEREAGSYSTASKYSSEDPVEGDEEARARYLSAATY